MALGKSHHLLRLDALIYPVGSPVFRGDFMVTVDTLPGSAQHRADDKHSVNTSCYHYEA